MSISIAISTELEGKIAKRASEQGKNVEQFALEALTRAVDAPSLHELFADVLEQRHVNCLPNEELDSRIDSAVNEVRKQSRD